jgi:hypothetical protein
MLASAEFTLLMICATKAVKFSEFTSAASRAAAGFSRPRVQSSKSSCDVFYNCRDRLPASDAIVRSPSLLHFVLILDPSGLDDIWSKSKDALFRAVQKLASIGSEPELNEHTRSLVTLATKYGGLGLSNFLLDSFRPHSTRASSKLADAFAQHLDLIRERRSGADQELLSSSCSQVELQHYQREEADDVLELLDDSRRLAVIEKSSAIGSAWLRMTSSVSYFEQPSN